ncbi:hypothetical protein EJ02DRAFT_486881 [Clathrospora elynae]|uniref:Uncharacterized protein n=1 Tax=Clathrospora elynae TaxID=706981 RepID=A0A6A5S4M8_9PLEO|nr:hypothetical protein EJ02DRAFT_486881 [Clathrospora elynae]
MTLLGSRPGEFIESAAWKHSNEGLLYGDIDLVRYKNGTYAGFLLHLRLRNRKGHQNNKKHLPVMLLYEETTMRSMCPVTHFMALALADGVFEECNSFQDIEAKELLPGSSLYKYRYNINNDGLVSEDNILTYNCFNNMLKGIGQRAGYEDRLSAYCFRRAYAKAVEKTATPAQRRLLMGHSNNDTVMYYISGIVGIDSQSMVHGRDQRTELIEENSSMMSKRNLLAPMPPGSQLTNRGSIARAIKPDNPVSVVTLSEHTPKEEYALRRQSRTVAYRKQRENFFEGKTTTPQRAAVSVSAQATPKPLRSPLRYLQALWKFEPERKAIASLMYPDCDTGAEDSKDTGIDSATKVKIPLKDILEPMVNLSNPEKKRYTYASASPTKDRCCSVCGKQFIKNDKHHAPLQVRFLQFDNAFDLHKHMKEHLTLEGPPSVCPHPHCQDMLGSEDKFWSHAETVHGMPPFGPRQSTGKRKAPEELVDLGEGTDNDSCHQNTKTALQLEAIEPHPIAVIAIFSGRGI